MDNTQPQQNPQPSQPAFQQPQNPPPPANSNQNGMSHDTKTLIVILLLIFAYGIGVIFMWLWMKTWPLWLKILLTLPIFLVIAIFALAIIVTVKNPQQLQQEIVQNEQIAQTPTPFNQKDVLSPTASPSATQEQIKAALTSKNYAALESYMNENVNFILYASECCGQITATEAASQLSYLDSATSPWDFDQSNPIITKIKTQYAQEYGSLFIGIASNEYLAAFGFDQNGKINNIKLAVTYKLLISE